VYKPWKRHHNAVVHVVSTLGAVIWNYSVCPDIVSVRGIIPATLEIPINHGGASLLA
jgi:hypothetical protein